MYIRTAADRQSDDEERFVGHLASFVVVAVMLGLMTVSRALSVGTFAAILVAWGALVAVHGRSVYRRSSSR